MKRALLIAILLLTFSCGGLAAVVSTLTGGHQAVRVFTIPIPGTRGIILITTPCDSLRSGSIGLWTTRRPIHGMHVFILGTWFERRDFFSGGIVNRLLLRITTFQRC